MGNKQPVFYQKYIQCNRVISLNTSTAMAHDASIEFDDVSKNTISKIGILVLEGKKSYKPNEKQSSYLELYLDIGGIKHLLVTNLCASEESKNLVKSFCNSFIETLSQSLTSTKSVTMLIDYEITITNINIVAIHLNFRETISLKFISNLKFNLSFHPKEVDLTTEKILGLVQKNLGFNHLEVLGEINRGKRKTRKRDIDYQDTYNRYDYIR